MRAQPGFTPHVATIGSGPRKFLALHCTMAFSGAWKGLSKALGDHVTFVAPDMPSHGRSADWDETSSFADTVFKAAESCLDGPMDVIGHSFGGVIALRLALEHPDLVRSLTMIEPVFFHVARIDAPDSVLDHNDNALDFVQSLRAGNRELAARQFNRTWSDSASWESIPEQTRAAMARAIHVVPDTTDFLYNDTAQMMPRLSRATMPSLLIRGAKSMDIVAQTNSGIARRLPDATDAVLAGAGHMAPISHPRDVARLWQETFLSV